MLWIRQKKESLGQKISHVSNLLHPVSMKLKICDFIGSIRFPVSGAGAGVAKEGVVYVGQGVVAAPGTQSFYGS